MLELFARLNVKTPNYEPSQGDGNPIITQEDLCGVLASFPEQYSWYIYAAIDQRRSYNMELLHRYFKQRVMQEMRNKKYVPKICTVSAFADGVTKAAVWAFFYSKGQCPKCVGDGGWNVRVWNKNTHKYYDEFELCPQCDGTGRKEYNWSERVNYGFYQIYLDSIQHIEKDDSKPPMPFTRKWYTACCKNYDNFIREELTDMSRHLVAKIKHLKQQEMKYRSEVMGIEICL